MKIKLLIITVFIAGLAKSAPVVDEGKAIFSQRCAACHNVNKIITGPALAGVYDRRPIDWIINFVNSSQTVIKKGDPYAVELFNKFNKIPMPDHPDLTEENIKNIVAYIKSEASTGAEKPPFEKPTRLHPAYVPLSLTANAGFFIAFLALVGLLIAALLFAVQLKDYERAARK